MVSKVFAVVFRKMEGTCNDCVFPLNEKERTIAGICPTDTSLTYAAGEGKLSCVKELITAGADVNIGCDCHGNGPLVSAVSDGHVECLKALITAGAVVNIQNNNEQTALMFVTDSLSIDELITAEADVNIKDIQGNTALMYAVGKENVDLVKMMISAGADVNTINKRQVTAVVLAVNGEYVEIEKELIAAGVRDAGRNCSWTS